MGAMATLMDVARLAGVSKATVSLALNGKRVNETTRQHVLDCAKKLNYVPNRIGRTLSTGKSGTIQLLVINSVKYINFFREISFFYHVLEGILTSAENHQYSLHFDVKNWEDDALPAYFDTKARDRTIDGMLIIPQFIRNYSFMPVLEQRGLPYVILDPCILDERVNSVKMDNYWGAKLVAELFLANNFSNIAMINGPKDHYDASERERGFTETLLEQGVHVRKPAVFYGDFSMKSGFAGMESILGSAKPEAVFCTNDYMAAGALRCLLSRGLRVPGDTALVGYDNTDVASTLYPQLTTVDNKMYELGKVLADSLFGIMEDTGRRAQTVLRPDLVIRETCPAPAAGKND